MSNKIEKTNMGPGSNYNPTTIHINSTDEPKSKQDDWQRSYEDYCFLYNVAYDAIIECLSRSDPKSNHHFEESSKNVNQEGEESNSSQVFKTFNEESESRKAIRIKAFANYLAAQPNIVKIKKCSKKSKTSDFKRVRRPKLATSEEYEKKLAISLEKRQKALEAKQRLMKARKKWYDATN